MINCTFCDRKLKTKQTYLTHLKGLHLENSPNNKADIIEEIGWIKQSTDIAKLTCEFCQKTYSNEYVLAKHQRGSCKANLAMLDKREFMAKFKRFLLDNQDNHQILNEMKKEINQMLPVIEETMQARSVSHSTISHSNIVQGDQINNQNNINNQININMKMSDFGQESECYLNDEKFINEIFDVLAKNLVLDNRRYGGGWRINHSIISEALIKMYRFVHCNSAFPENHNIYVTNKKYYLPFQIYKDSRWVLGKSDDFENAVSKQQDRLVRLLKILIENNPEEKETLENILEAYGYEKNTKREKLAKDFFNESYNHKSLISQTHKVTNSQEYIQTLLNK